jgi:hypothetical protein
MPSSTLAVVNGAGWRGGGGWFRELRAPRPTTWAPAMWVPQNRTKGDYGLSSARTSLTYLFTRLGKENTYLSPWGRELPKTLTATVSASACQYVKPFLWILSGPYVGHFNPVHTKFLDDSTRYNPLIHASVAQDDSFFRFLANTVYSFPSPTMRAAYLPYLRLSWFEHSMYDKECTLWSSLLCLFLRSLDNFDLLSPDFLLDTVNEHFLPFPGVRNIRKKQSNNKIFEASI